MNLLEQIYAVLKARKEDAAIRYPKLIAKCPYETRLAIAAQVFQAIREHANEGGTFRYLIYNRLGFDSNAYVPLCYAGGLDVSNMCNERRTPCPAVEL